MYLVGLMSGTSADGIDAALCEIKGAPPQLEARIIAGATLPYPDNLRERVLAAFNGGTSAEICQLNVAVGAAFAAAAKHIQGVAGIRADLIGSHGQTLWHQVEADGQVSATLQIGEAAVIAEQTGLTTISNFRPRDIAAGGQGAPLTSYADWLLLRHPHKWRAVQNIGGIGNVSFLPPLDDPHSPALAFDTGPGNALIDSAVHLLTQGALAYDVDGQLAAQGRIDETWLHELLQHPYFQQAPPKTTGRELFGTPLAASLIQAGLERGLNTPGILATLTALTAFSIAEAYQRFAPQPVQEVVLGGGGSHNQTLRRYLQAGLGEQVVVMSHEALGLDSDFKEALVFALLAYESWHARPGTLPALTGARHPSVLGQITPGENYATLLRATWT